MLGCSSGALSRNFETLMRRGNPECSDDLLGHSAGRTFETLIRRGNNECSDDLWGALRRYLLPRLGRVWQLTLGSSECMGRSKEAATLLLECGVPVSAGQNEAQCRCK
jgi:hypothetical protein